MLGDDLGLVAKLDRGWSNLHNHLLAAQERVAQELARSNGNWCVRHVYGFLMIDPKGCLR